ncbi:MAG: PhoH family protein [Bacillota bacterium]
MEAKAREGKNVIIVDTNVLIQAPDRAIQDLQKGGNIVVIPWQVIQELDGLKSSKEIGREAQGAIKKIHERLLRGDGGLVIERKAVFDRNLDKNKADHKVLACVNHIVGSHKRPSSPYFGYGKIKLVTNDFGMQICANELWSANGLIVDFYKNDQTKLKNEDFALPTFKAKQSEILFDDVGSRYVELKKKEKIPTNGAVLIYTDADDYDRPECAAIRKRDRLIFLENQFSVSGIKPRDNGHPNWQQIIAMHFLLDPDVKCIFLQGGAGTGKTLLALAAALCLKHRKQCSQIIVSRPMVELNDEEMGWLPGEIANKFSPWLLPIFQNLALLMKEKKVSPDTTKPKKRKKKEDDEAPKQRMPIATGSEGVKLLEEKGISIQPLAYIRGTSFPDSNIIIDEAQNLTRHKIKTIITRAGEGTKIIFTGDLGQIDNPRLTRESSGLAHAISKMKGNRMVGIVNFEQTIRSELVEFADKVL